VNRSQPNRAQEGLRQPAGAPPPGALQNECVREFLAQNASVSEKDAKPVITLITLDRKSSSFAFTRSDGKEARFPLDPSFFAETSALSRVHYTAAFDGLLAVTRSGDEIIFEVAKRENGDQIASRLVVYLDQNQWSAVARAIHDPDQSPSADQHAAQQLAEWAKQRLIILPASSGHYYETTKWADGAARYRLGLTILQLSRGWQMRDPLQVRRNELFDAFRRRFSAGIALRDASVFSLSPNVLHGESLRGGQTYSSPAEFPADLAFQHEALSSAMGFIDVMLDSEHIEPGPTTDWAGSNQRFSDWLDGEKREPQQKRRCIDAFLLSDLQKEIAEEANGAGMTSEQLSMWLQNEMTETIRGLPATGLFGEMLHDRHLNTGTTWKTNDLTDMVYLSCAAGYADFVVCERHMGAVLTQGIKRLGLRQNVFRRLRDAVPAIEAALRVHAGLGS
jgi:hypothetical protein